MTNEELRESLLATHKNGYARITPEQKEEMNAYCKRYMAFMDACKTSGKPPPGPLRKRKSWASSPSPPA